MCGRYCLYADDNEEIRDILDRTEGEFKTGEIFPTDHAPVLFKQRNIVRSVAVGWGFPGFKGKGVIINARAETVPEKPMFRNCLLTGRCIVPSSGFFEWSHDGKKTKYRFNLPETGVLYMAGLAGIFNGERRFVIVTTAANASMASVHNRMPVIFGNGEAVRWLESPDSARDILQAGRPMLTKQAI